MVDSLYPEIKPFDSGFVNVSSKHKLYYEQCGNPQGEPIVFLHGGPGGGILPEYRRYFDPLKWRLVLFDQRGCGRSLPFASLDENTTWHLVADIDLLKKHLKISKWSVFGGSWGSTLALAYAQTYPQNCSKLYLRGIFLLRKKEIDWFYQEGASKIFPDAWEKFIKPISHCKRDHLLKAYYELLLSNNSKTSLEAAKSWSVWEAATSKLIQNDNLQTMFSEDSFATAFARIECHYFINYGFFKEDNYLINHIDKIRHIPTWIVQGRYDVVCPMESAWELHKSWPEAHFQIIADAGHSLSEVGIQKYLISTLNH